jgi:hypothetical protein
VRVCYLIPLRGAVSVASPRGLVAIPTIVAGTLAKVAAISAGGGALASLQVGMTPEADMTPGSNATYVFALP